jgi:PAS domain S-box-containing protein
MATPAIESEPLASPPFPRRRVLYGMAVLLAIAVVPFLIWPILADLILASNFLPHLYCYLGKPGLVWTHVIADSLIGLSYVMISGTLAYLAHKGRRDIPFHWVFLAFGSFIVACGGTHFMEVVTVWVPVYVLSASLKVVTALVSVATAVLLPFTVPRVLSLVQTAKASEAAEAKFHQIADNIQEIFWMVDAITKQAIYVNPAFEQITGRTCTSLQEAPLSYREIIHPDDRAHVLSRLDEASRTGDFDEEFRITHPDGTLRWVGTQGFPIRDAKGNIYRLAGVVQDITDRKRAEQALRKSEERFRLAAQAGKMFAYEWDAASDVIVRSAESAQILGIDEATHVTGQQIMTRVHPDDREKLSAAIAELNLEKPHLQISYRVVRSDGTVIWVERNSRAHFDEQGRMLRIVGMVTDITERKRAEESLQLFRMLIDQSNDAIEVVDPETLRFIDINGKTCLDLGYSREELLSMSVYDIDPNVDELMRARVIDELRISGSTILESLHRRKDGSTFPVEVSIKQVQLDRIYLVTVARDIAERKQTEQALRESQAALARVTRIAAMGELTASIAHEINQPLAAVATNASATLRWLAAEPPNLDEAREAVGRAIQEANRASGVIKRIRALLQKEQPQLRPLDGNEVIRDVVLLAESELLRGGVTVKTELAVDVPTVLGDRIQLQQVILNLIMNGIDAMSAIADRPRELLVQSAAHPEGLLIQVQDSGKGIDGEQAGRIFEPFFTTKPQGIGMGLSISRSIVEAHGGRLWATAGPSYGAVFQLLLPKADSSDD